MKVVALITWIITAGGGIVLLGTWLSRGGMRQQQTGQTRLPSPLVFGHFLLAAAGLVVWIVYLLGDIEVLTWVAFVLLVPVALLGFTMFARWLGVRGGRDARATVAPKARGTASVAAAAGTGAGEVPAETHFPVTVVVAHGVLAAVTLVLVLLVALGVGGS